VGVIAKLGVFFAADIGGKVKVLEYLTYWFLKIIYEQMDIIDRD